MFDKDFGGRIATFAIFTTSAKRLARNHDPLHPGEADAYCSPQPQIDIDAVLL